MPIDLDFSEAGSGGLLPEGDYLLRITEAWTRETNNKPGNWNLDIKFAVMQPEDLSNMTHFDEFSLLRQSQWKLKKFLEAATKREWPAEAGLKLDENEIIGLYVRATIFHSTYNGVTRAKTREYFPDLEYGF